MANAYTIKATPEATDSITISDVSGAIFKATLGSLPGTSSAVGGYVDPPVYSDSSGIKGQYSFDAEYIYMCIADNSWDRLPVAWDAWGTAMPENPVVLSPVIDVSGAALTLNFDRNVFQGSAYLDSDFNLDASVSGSNISIAYSSGDGTDTHVYAISKAIQLDEVVNLDYNGKTNGLEDSSGNDLGVILNFSVTNNSTAGLGITARIDDTEGGQRLLVTFPEAVNCNHDGDPYPLGEIRLSGIDLYADYQSGFPGTEITFLINQK